MFVKMKTVGRVDADGPSGRSGVPQGHTANQARHGRMHVNNVVSPIGSNPRNSRRRPDEVGRSEWITRPRNIPHVIERVHALGIPGDSVGYGIHGPTQAAKVPRIGQKEGAEEIRDCTGNQEFWHDAIYGVAAN